MVILVMLELVHLLPSRKTGSFHVKIQEEIQNEKALFSTFFAHCNAARIGV